MNSFNKTEAAVFSCRLCFPRAFPFISLIFIHPFNHISLWSLYYIIFPSKSSSDVSRVYSLPCMTLVKTRISCISTMFYNRWINVPNFCRVLTLYSKLDRANVYDWIMVNLYKREKAFIVCKHRCFLPKGSFIQNNQYTYLKHHPYRILHNSTKHPANNIR